MRNPLRRTASDDESSGPLAALALAPGERVLAHLTPDAGGLVAVTTWALAIVAPDGTVSVHRPWHEVQTAQWDGDTGALSVLWFDARHPLQIAIPQSRPFLQALRERVQASVVLTSELALGLGRTGRVAIRADLATGELMEQVVLGRRTRADDPDVAEAVLSAVNYLREQVGLPRR